MLEDFKNDTKNLVFVYTTCLNKEEAIKISLSTIEKKLAISADFWPIESIYPWKGVIQQVDQYMLVLNSQKGLGDKLIKFIEEIHSYHTPVIASFEACHINYPYKFWMDGLLMNKEKYLSEKEAKVRQKQEEEGVYHYGKIL
jgi:uncharacterized protein involved in tolerance to divalent cations